MTQNEMRPEEWDLLQQRLQEINMRLQAPHPTASPFGPPLDMERDELLELQRERDAILEKLGEKPEPWWPTRVA